MFMEHLALQEEQMVFISTVKGTFEFRSVNEAVEFVQAAAKEKDTFWISGEEKYPCLAVCTNAPYAAVHFFQGAAPDDAGNIWLSYNEYNQKEIVFLAEGAEWRPTADAAISLDDAVLCIREFLSTGERPSCIRWQEM